MVFVTFFARVKKVFNLHWSHILTYFITFKTYKMLDLS